MSTNRQPYEGRWELLPELSLYEEGEAPRSGVYEITREGSDVRFCVEWEGGDGQRGEVRFSGPSDGRRASISHPPGAEVAYLHVDGATLDSSVFVGDVRAAHARRRVSSDGRLLAVVQETRRADGTTFRNFQVYRRDEP